MRLRLDVPLVPPLVCLLLAAACDDTAPDPLDAAIDTAPDRPEVIADAPGLDAPGLDAGIVDAAVERIVYHSHESQYCSSDPADDPYYDCAPGLVCTNTYQELVRGPDGGSMRIPIYLCRLSCVPGTACLNGELCCPGRGIQGQMQPGCVPESRCDPPSRDQ